MTFRLPRRVPEGLRNDQLCRRAGQLRRHGADVDEIADELLAANASRCVPPLPVREVLTIARSIAKYPPAGPEVRWHAPPRDLVEVARRRGYRLIGSVIRIDHFHYQVGGRRGGGPFDVLPGGSAGPTCSCTWFANRLNETGTCAHCEAVEAWVRSRYGALEAGLITTK